MAFGVMQEEKLYIGVNGQQDELLGGNQDEKLYIGVNKITG